MKTNGKIQLYPMVRMTVLLILGMVMAYYTSSHIPSWLWLGGTLILLLMTPLVRHCHATCLSFRWLFDES